MLGNDVHNINVLTVIASESYDSFAKGLQSEIAEAVANRPKAVTPELFEGRTIADAEGNTDVISSTTALNIWFDLRTKGYVDDKNALTDKYYEDKANGLITLADEVAACADSIIRILDSVYDPMAMLPDNARSNNVELTVDQEKLHSKEFKAQCPICVYR